MTELLTKFYNGIINLIGKLFEFVLGIQRFLAINYYAGQAVAVVFDSMLVTRIFPAISNLKLLLP